MLESSDPIEQVVADMQIRLERLEAHDRTEGSESRAEFLLDHVALGELLHRLPRDATDADRMLLAGHGAQVRSIDNSFSTGESNALLTEQGVKIGNPSRSVKMNVIARRVFRHQRRYRVSQIGLDHLAHLKRLILAS